MEIVLEKKATYCDHLVFVIEKIFSFSHATYKIKKYQWKILPIIFFKLKML